MPSEHGLIHFALVCLDKLERDQTATYRTFRFQCRLLCFISQRFILLQRIELFSPSGENRRRRHSCVFAIWIWIPRLRDLRVNISGFVFLAESFKTSRFEIACRKRYSGLLRPGGGAMKKRQRSCVVLVHGRFPPRPLANNPPLQNRRNHIVAILENVGLDYQIFAQNTFDGGTAAIN